MPPRFTVAKAGGSALAPRSRRSDADDGEARAAEALSRKVSPAETVGATGQMHAGGFVESRESDPALQGTEKYRTWDNNHANHEIISTGVSEFVDLVGKPEWKFEAVDESAEAKRAAELVENVVADLATPWNETIRKAAMYVFRGFSVFEWTAVKREDGAVGIYDLELRPCSTIDRWGFDRYNVVLGCYQRHPKTFVEAFIPRWKMLHFVDNSVVDTPEGLGIYRCLTKAAHRLEQYGKFEGQGFETDLAGIPILEAPISEMRARVAAKEPGWTDARVTKELDAFRTFMLNHVRNVSTALMHDSDVYRSKGGGDETPSGAKKWTARLLQGAGSTAHAQMQVAIERITTAMARRLGIEQKMMGGQSAGTYGASRDKTKGFANRVDASLLLMRQVVRRDWLRPLMILNGIDPALAPYPKTDKLVWAEPAELAAVLRERALAGVPLQQGSEIDNALTDIAGLPNDEEVDLDAEEADLSLMPGRKKKPATDPDEDEGA